MKPFLKWPGGKRWAASQIAEYVRRYLKGKYYEPFLGGGAVFFHLCPERAVLSDINHELITTYREVQKQPVKLADEVRTLRIGRSSYLRIRASRPRTSLRIAARFLYLNRTAFGGLYRLSRDGQFNVPYGGGQRTPRVLWRSGLLDQASRVLQKADLLCSDFGVALEAATQGDVVYCDPTYTIAHDNNGFRRYNEAVFSWWDQERLRNLAFCAVKRGATVLVSNAHHKDLAMLYRSRLCLEAKELARMSCVATEPKHRRLVREYLFVLRDA